MRLYRLGLQTKNFSAAPMEIQPEDVGEMDLPTGKTRLGLQIKITAEELDTFVDDLYAAQENNDLAFLDGENCILSIAVVED